MRWPRLSIPSGSAIQLHGLGIVAWLGLVLAANAVYVGDWPRFGASIAACGGLGFWLLRRILADNAAQRREQE